jgi:ribosomal silencing factor RsfS
LNSDKYTKGILQLLEETKAEDIQIIDVRDKTPFSEYYILVTPLIRAENDLKAVVEKIETQRKHSVEGNENRDGNYLNAIMYHQFLNRKK